jgi:hypothetical protein
MNVRNAEPGDYLPIISVIDEWWGRRKMSRLLQIYLACVFMGDLPGNDILLC